MTYTALQNFALELVPLGMTFDDGRDAAPLVRFVDVAEQIMWHYRPDGPGIGVTISSTPPPE